MHGFVEALREVCSLQQSDAAVSQSSVNYGWGCGKISVANDAKVNLKGDSHGSEEKSSKEKSS
jgi:hypothetical protein